MDSIREQVVSAPVREAGRGLRLLGPACDLAVLVAFVVIGRHNHGEGDATQGVVETLWPFLAGWTAATLASRTYARPENILRWAVTLVVALGIAFLIRLITLDHVIPVFMAVTTGFVGLFTLAWRLALRAVTRRSDRRDTTRVTAPA